eukprot:13795234-Alexandrium_andersonii.AAC.1
MFAQSAPVGSHQSIGAAEQCHQVVRGRTRTLISEVGQHYGADVDPTTSCSRGPSAKAHGPTPALRWAEATITRRGGASTGT